MPGPADILFRLKLVSLRILRRRPRKVFCIGFNKTGTTSLHLLFESLGLRSYHGLRWHDVTNAEIYSQFDCFSDGFPLSWRSLVLDYPEARFILNVRDCYSWVLSRLRHIDRAKRAGTYTGGTSWGLWDDTLEAVTSWIQQWHAHHLEVLDAFDDQPERFLVVNMIADPTAGSRVAAFLGYRGKLQAPHANPGQAGEKSEAYTALIDEACLHLGIPRAELDNDLLIPALLDGRNRGFPSRTSDVDS